MQKPLILIDGSSYLYRAYHALPPLTNSQGEPTGAIYGVINMIRRLLKDYDPDHIAVIFDPKGKTTRHEIYTEYKAHRPPMQDELSAQVPPLFDVIKAMGLPLVIIDGVEADDVIGTLAKTAEAQGLKTIISTGDKDIAQLVNDKITLINTMTNQTLDIPGVKEKFGVKPEQIIDYLALMGDATDNIPGVPKVGPKTAVKWLEEYGSLDNVIKNADKISGKVGENLRAHVSELPLSRKLVTIYTDIKLPVTIADLKRQPANNAILIDLFKRLEFKTWLNEVLSQPSSEVEKKTENAQLDYQIILTESHWQQVWQEIQKATEIAFDTETTSLDAMNAELVGICLAIKPNQGFYIPLAHDYPGAPVQLDRNKILQEMQILFGDTKKTIIAQNLKYDLTVMENYGIKLRTKFFDTMLESYVLNSTSNRHDMDSLAFKYLGRHTITFEDIAGKGAKQVTFNQITLDKAGEYAAEDADVTLQLHHALSSKINADKHLASVLHEIELPLIPILAQMERIGVLVDKEQLGRLSKIFGERIEELQQQAYQLAGEEFNLGSPKQLQEILYQKLKIPVLKKTPTGVPSTSEEVLQELAANYPLPKIILEYRSLSKLKSTYADALVEKIDPKTRRVHTSYNQAITATGRLSSTDPNLQNIPVRTEEGRKIRQAFIAPPGYKIISADYSQIELRIMAHLSQDKGLLKAFAQDSDIHKATAAEVFNVPLEKVSSEQRRSAKAINFGLIYGMSAFGLAKALSVSREVAQQYIDLYFSRYPSVKQFMETIRLGAHQRGFVETLFGRRLYLMDINTSNLQRQKAAERAAINAPMQGTAADIIKIAMMKLDRWIAQSSLDVKMIMQVHDELVFEVAEKDIDAAVIAIRKHMTEIPGLDVPLAVEISAGNNWDEAH